MSKTVFQERKEIPKPVRKLAVRNMIRLGTTKNSVRNVKEIIDKSFTWSNTPEGHGFWSEVHNYVQNGVKNDSFYEEIINCHNIKV